MSRPLPVSVALVSFLVLRGAAQAPAPTVTALVQADSPEAAEAAARRVGKDVSFDEAWRRLKEGRPYGPLRTGRVDLPSSDHGTRLDNVLEVPPDYVPGRKWPLRVTLHGGVGRPAPDPGDDPPRPLTNRTPSEGELVLHPRAFADSEWWRPGQVDNVMRLIDEVKRRYNVDESHIYLTGISDGGTGAYYLAMRVATLWAACMPMNGHPSVLANPEVGADGQLYPANMANCPWRIVNGGRDRLYPAASVEPLDRHVPPRRHPAGLPGVSGGGARHELVAAGACEERGVPGRASARRASGADHLGDRAGGSLQPLPVAGDRLARRACLRRPAGRCQHLHRRPRTSTWRCSTARSRRAAWTSVRSGNTFELQTRGVRELTLLLSPDAVDFAAPVVVTVNGATVHNKVVARDVATLVRWAARDNDRSMLYGAELHITVP